jgi:hypothetical protein
MQTSNAFFPWIFHPLAIPGFEPPQGQKYLVANTPASRIHKIEEWLRGRNLPPLETVPLPREWTGEVSMLLKGPCRRLLGVRSYSAEYLSQFNREYPGTGSLPSGEGEWSYLLLYRYDRNDRKHELLENLPLGVMGLAGARLGSRAGGSEGRYSKVIKAETIFGLLFNGILWQKDHNSLLYDDPGTRVSLVARGQPENTTRRRKQKRKAKAARKLLVYYEHGLAVQPLDRLSVLIQWLYEAGKPCWVMRPEGGAMLPLLRDDDYEQFVREKPMPREQWLQFARDFQDAGWSVKTLLQERGYSIIREVTAKEELTLPAALPAR